MRIALAALVLALAAGDARAEDKPWAAGVSQADQDKALALYREGNEYFDASEYKQAYERYKQALAAWQHPLVHYNAAVCLINLDKPLEAYEHIVASLKFGAAPLGKDLHKQAISYEKLLANQTAVLEVRCNEPDATITLDGARLLACPGTERRRLLPGPHQIVGEKARYKVETVPIELKAGQTTTIEITLKLADAEKRLERRWNKWVPWSVVATGAILGASGIWFHVNGNQDHELVASDLEKCEMGCPRGEALAANIERHVARGDRRRAVASSLYALGAAGIVAGIAMVVVNQPRLVVAPAVGGESAGVTISGLF